MYDQVLQRSNGVKIIITSMVIIGVVVFPTIYKVIAVKTTNTFLHTAYLIIKHVAWLVLY